MTKSEILNAFEAVGLSLPKMTTAVCETEWECKWEVDREDLHEEATEIKELLMLIKGLDWDRKVYPIGSGDIGWVYAYIRY